MTEKISNDHSNTTTDDDDDTEESCWSPILGNTAPTDIIQEAWNSSTDDKDRVSTEPHPLIPSWYELKIDGDLVSYYCELCFKPSCNRAYMRHHLKQHLGRYIYQCNVCGETFPIYRLVRLHKRSHDFSFNCNNNKMDNDMNSMGLLRYSGVSLLRRNPSTSKSVMKMTPGKHAGQEEHPEEDPQQQGKMEGTMSRALTDLLKALRLTDVCQTSWKHEDDDDNNNCNHQKNPFPYKCSACSVGFTSPDALIGHIITEGELNKLYGPASISSTLKKRNPAPTKL